MKYSIDRIEDGYVILENKSGSVITVDAVLFPAEIKSGDIVVYDNGKYQIDSDSTRNAKKHISELRKNMLNKFSKE